MLQGKASILTFLHFPPQKCVFQIFSPWEKVKMSASNLRWLSPKQNVSVLSAGTKGSVSNHFWQHIKLHFYPSLKLARPLSFPFSGNNLLFSLCEPGERAEGGITGTWTLLRGEKEGLGFSECGSNKGAVWFSLDLRTARSDKLKYNTAEMLHVPHLGHLFTSRLHCWLCHCMNSTNVE